MQTDQSFDQYFHYKGQRTSDVAIQYKVFKNQLASNRFNTEVPTTDKQRETSSIPVGTYFHPQRKITNTTSVKSISISEDGTDIEKGDYVAELDYNNNVLNMWKFEDGERIDYRQNKFELEKDQKILYWEMRKSGALVYIYIGSEKEKETPTVAGHQIDNYLATVCLWFKFDDDPITKKDWALTYKDYFTKVVDSNPREDQVPYIIPGGESWIFGSNTLETRKYLYEVEDNKIVKKTKEDIFKNSESWNGVPIQYNEKQEIFSLQRTFGAVNQILGRRIHALSDSRFCLLSGRNCFIFSPTEKMEKKKSNTNSNISRIVQVGDKYYGYLVKGEKKSDKYEWNSAGMCEITLKNDEDNGESEDQL